MDRQGPDNRQSRLKVGSVGILTTLLYLWLAVLGVGGFGAFQPPCSDCPRRGKHADGQRGVL